MLRVNHRILYSLLTKQSQNRGTPSLLLPAPSFRLPKLDLIRPYSKKDKKLEPSSCEQARTTDKAALDECKPEVRKPPCGPLSSECSKLPSIDDCRKENLLNECPKPDCPWDESDPPNKRNYGRWLLLGLILAALAAGAIFMMSYTPPPKKKKKKKAKTKRRHGIVEKHPTKSSMFLKNIPYLVVGGGTTAFAAFRSIKSADPTAKIMIISAEGNYPYMRPPLSKEMWQTEDKDMLERMEFTQWNGKTRSVYYEPDDFYQEMDALKRNANGGVTVATGWRIDKIDVENRIAYLEDGAPIEYGKCLLATGSRPKVLNVLKGLDESVQDRVNHCRTVEDFNCLRDNIQDAKVVVVIGGSFLGSEMACGLARFGKKQKLKVIQVFKEPGNLAKILPEYLSYWTSARIGEEGVEVIPDVHVTEAIADGEQIQLTFSNNTSVHADEVVCCVGNEPNVQMAKASLLEVDPKLSGFLVNAELQARSHLFAAGDCASYYDLTYGRRHLEHHDNAVVTGRIAGENMAGSTKPYVHQSMFWSDLGPNLGFEAIGVVDSRLPTVGVFAKSSGGEAAGGGATTETKERQGRNTDAPVPDECEKYTSKEHAADQRSRLAMERKEKSMERGNEDFGKGVIFYLKDDVVVGMLMWNVFHRMSIARQVLADHRKYDDLNEVAKLFKIHEE